jgi:hypothetical protein
MLLYKDVRIKKLLTKTPYKKIREIHVKNGHFVKNSLTKITKGGLTGL